MERCSDGEMQNILKLYGEDPGPIRETTRLMYEKRLAKHLDQQPHQQSYLSIYYIYIYIFFFNFFFFNYLFLFLFIYLIF